MKLKRLEEVDYESDISQKEFKAKLSNNPS
jgi:hypothetical protein